MKKIILLIIMIYSTACTKYIDLKDLSIIKSIGISYDNGYTIYLQIYEEIKKDNIPKMKIVKSYSNSMAKAIDNIKKIVNSEIFFSHIDLLILDTKLQDNNFQEIINYFITNKFRNDYDCIFSDDIDKLLNNTKYNEIENLLKTNTNITNNSFNIIANSFLEKKEIILPKINYEKSLVLYDNKIERILNE